MMEYSEVLIALRELRTQAGYSKFDRAVKTLNRERVNPERDKREGVSWKETRAMAKRQRWICGICKDPEKRMADDRMFTVCDHIDPNADDFNAPSNKQAAHKSCNASKGSNDFTKEARRMGVTITEYLGRRSKD